MEYTLESYAPLLTDEYGGEECFGEEFEMLKKMLEVEKAEEIIFTTSEDGELGHYEKCTRLAEYFKKFHKLKESESNGTDYILVDFDGTKVVMTNYPFDIFFIKISDKEKFDEQTKNF